MIIFFSFHQNVMILSIIYSTVSANWVHKKIVGGRPAFHNEFPQLVSLIWNESALHFCGGSIISPWHVLTAAHCLLLDHFRLKLNPHWISVVGGRHILNDMGIERRVSKIILHHNYVIETKENDIAIVKLSSAFEWSANLQPLPLAEKPVSPNIYVLVAGFGLRQMNGTLSHRLRVAEVQIYENKFCQSLFENRVKLKPGMICAGTSRKGINDACYGDSGGPMVYKNELIGVISSGIGCASLHSPGVYSDVNYHRKWIDDVIQNE